MVIRWVLTILIAVSLTNCAGDQQQDELIDGQEGYDEGETDEDYAAGQSDQGENYGNQGQGQGENYGNEGQGENYGNESQGENYGNEGQSNSYGNGAEENYGQQGESLNNALGNDTQENYAMQGEGQNPLESEGEALNNATENEFAEEPPPPMEEQPAIDTSTDDGAQMAAADSLAPVAAPQPGGRVMYVRSAITVYTSPGGAAAGTLERGDHPLVWTADSIAQAGVTGDMAMNQQGASYGQENLDAQAPPADGASYDGASGYDNASGNQASGLNYNSY